MFWCSLAGADRPQAIPVARQEDKTCGSLCPSVALFVATVRSTLKKSGIVCLRGVDVLVFKEKSEGA